MKNGKMRFVYEIGDAPCRACDIGDVLDAVEDFPAADARPVVWGHDTGSARIFSCSECGYGIEDIFLSNEEDYPTQPNYCPNCGAMMEES